MEAYLSYKKESLDQASAQATASLTAEAGQLKSQLDQAQAKLHDLEASNNVVFLQQQGAGAESYLASLNRRLAILRTELRLLDSLTPSSGWRPMPPAQAPSLVHLPATKRRPGKLWPT